jgi:hypothetical protein
MHLSKLTKAVAIALALALAVPAVGCAAPTAASTETLATTEQAVTAADAVAGAKPAVTIFTLIQSNLQAGESVVSKRQILDALDASRGEVNDLNAYANALATSHRQTDASTFDDESIAKLT